MPGYVRADRPDIFISYAHANDLAFDEGPGWVNKLVRHVEILLTMKIGRRESFDLWMDPRLSGNEPVTDLLEGRIRESAVFVLILSPGYLASKWCDRELQTFRELVGRRKGDGSRVFVVEFDKVDRPLELSDLRGYRFWVEDTLSGDVSTLGFPKLLPEAEERYYRMTEELVRDLVNELDRQKRAGSPDTHRPAAVAIAGAGAGVGNGGGVTVYLADVPEDLEDLRDEVKSYLIQAGHQILPRIAYPADLEGYNAAVVADLAGSNLFIQLLSELPGRKFIEDGTRRVALLLDRAASRVPPIPILQWRSRDLDWGRVTNETHRKILKGEAIPGSVQEIMEVDIEEFKAAVGRKITSMTSKVVERPKAGDRFVFINADEPDDPLSTEVTRLLERWPWLGYGLPLRDGDPAQIRADLEQNLMDCDAMLLIFGASNPVWTRSQLQMARKILAVRDKPPITIAVYEGPPSDTKDKLNFRLPRMTVLNCRSGLDESEVDRFIRSLQAESGA